MTPEKFEAAVVDVARAIYMRDHPHTLPTTFDRVNEATRARYLGLARPEVLAAYEAFGVGDQHVHGDGSWSAGCGPCVNQDLEPS